MSRDLTTAVQNQLSASELEPFFAIKLAFDSGDVRIWTGYTDITVASETYIGGGQLLSISPVEETVEIAAKGVQFGLNGIDRVWLLLLSRKIIKVALPKCIWAFYHRAQYYQILLIFDGRMDVMTIQDSGDTASITLSAESRLIDLERPRVRRYTNSDQQNQFPGDTSLRFVADLQDKEIAWGSGKDDGSFDFGNIGNFTI